MTTRSRYVLGCLMAGVLLAVPVGGDTPTADAAAPCSTPTDREVYELELVEVTRNGAVIPSDPQFFQTIYLVSVSVDGRTARQRDLQGEGE